MGYTNTIEATVPVDDKRKGEATMKYVCDVCGYVYDLSLIHI